MLLHFMILYPNLWGMFIHFIIFHIFHHPHIYIYIHIISQLVGEIPQRPLGSVHLGPCSSVAERLADALWVQWGAYLAEQGADLEVSGYPKIDGVFHGICHYFMDDGSRGSRVALWLRKASHFTKRNDGIRVISPTNMVIQGEFDGIYLQKVSLFIDHNVKGKCIVLRAYVGLYGTGIQTGNHLMRLFIIEANVKLSAVACVKLWEDRIPKWWGQTFRNEAKPQPHLTKKNELSLLLLLLLLLLLF